MPKTMRSPQDAADNYVSNTQNAQSFWQARAEQADWQSGAASEDSERNYATGVNAAVAKKSRQVAIRATPNEVYKSGISSNPGRYSSGTASAKNKVISVMGKLLPEISAARNALPARGARGSAVNIMQRGTQIQTKLAAKRGMFKARGIGKTTGGV